MSDVRRTQLHVADDRLRVAIASGKAVAFEWDRQTDRTFWFGDLATMFGIDDTMFAGDVDDFRRFVHPEDRGAVWTSLQDAMLARSPFEAEFRVLWADGTVRWASSKGRYFYSADGVAERMLGTAVDITERKQADERLRRTQTELNEAQRLAGIGSWTWDPESDTVLWSEELYRIAGRDPRLPAVSYKEHSRLYTRESWEQLQQAVDRALRTDASYELVLEMVRADGIHRWITARGEVQRDASGRPMGLRGTVQDITERKRAEEVVSGVSRRLLEAQESERSRIARELHDDIGQRLALLSTELENVKGLLPASSSEAINRLDALQQRHEAIVVDLQALSHDLHPPRLQHLGLVAAMRGFCRELAEHKDFVVDFRHDNVPGNVASDVSLSVFRVLQEALHNAVRHSGGRHFTVDLHGTDDAVQLTVRDDGAGFDVGEASRAGGLGLTSMRERLALVGGELSIESQPAKGTTVIARAPVRPR